MARIVIKNCMVEMLIRMEEFTRVENWVYGLGMLKIRFRGKVQGFIFFNASRL